MKQKKITQQWLHAPIFEAFQNCARTRPDFEATVAALEQHDEMYLVKMTFHNVGSTTFTARLISFAIVAMRDHYKGPKFPGHQGFPAVYQGEGVTSQPEVAPEVSE